MIEILNYLHIHVFVFISIVIFFAIISSILWDNNQVKIHNSVIVSTSNQPLYFIILVFVLVWCWITFMPLSIGHRDEIAYFGEYIPAMIGAGRFFPLGHQEFNLLIHFFTQDKYYVFYILPFIELILFVVLIDKIINANNIFIRVYGLSMAFLLAGIIPFSNLIIPERNQIVLFLAGVYFAKSYNLTGKKISSIASIVSFALSMYYKEPTFAAIAGFISILFLYDFFDNFSQKDRLPVVKILTKTLTSLYIGVGVSILFFIMGYLFYTYYNGAPTEYYGNVNTSDRAILFNRFYALVLDTPILISLIFIAISAHFLIYKYEFDRRLSVAIAVCGIIYLAEITILGLPLNGYYYSIALLSLALSSAILFKQALRNKNTLDSRFFIFSILILVLNTIVIVKLLTPVWNDIVKKKNLSSMYSFIEKELLKSGDIKSIYYILPSLNYGDYTTAVLMNFFHKRNIDHEFNIYSQTGCAVWNEKYNGGLITCNKKDFIDADNYDVIVVENNKLPLVDINKYKIVEYRSKYYIKDSSDTISILHKISNYQDK